MIRTFKLFLLSVFILTVCQNISLAQVRLVLGPAFGLTLPAVDYSGETTDFYSGTKYGLKSGINYGIMSKLALGPLNARLSISYASLSNNGKGNPNDANSTLEVRSSIFTLSIGTELGFGVPLVPVKPYLGIDILFSTISGSVNFHNTSGVGSGSLNIQSASRTGLGLALGTELKLSTSLTLDASLRYNLLNLFSKDYQAVDNPGRIDAYSSLNDAKDPKYDSASNNHFIGNSRTIATIQFQLGILFGF